MVLTEKIEPFQPVSLQRIAEIIAEDLSGSKIRDFFNRAGFSHILFTNESKRGFVYTALQQIQNEVGWQRKVIELIEKFCDGQEFLGRSEKREPTIIKINEVLSFYKLRYDLKISTVVLDTRTKQSSQRQDTSLKRLNALNMAGYILRLLNTAEKEFNYEILKRGFPKKSEKIVDGALFLLKEYSLLKIDKDGNLTLTQKAKDILSEDIDLGTRILKLLMVNPFDLNEISVLLQKNFDITTSTFIALAQEKLVTSTSETRYPGSSLGIGTPVIQLTTKGIEFLKKDNRESPKFTIGTAENVYVGNTINVNNIQSTIEQLLVKIDEAKDMDNKTKKELKTRLEKLKYAANEALEFAKSVGGQFTVESLMKFFFPS
jgi:hypothetical protein